MANCSLFSKRPSGIYGDLQVIAGQNLKEIDALEGPMRLEFKAE